MYDVCPCPAFGSSPSPPGTRSRLPAPHRPPHTPRCRLASGGPVCVSPSDRPEPLLVADEPREYSSEPSSLPLPASRWSRCLRRLVEAYGEARPLPLRGCSSRLPERSAGPGSALPSRRLVSESSDMRLLVSWLLLARRDVRVRPLSSRCSCRISASLAGSRSAISPAAVATATHACTARTTKGLCVPHTQDRRGPWGACTVNKPASRAGGLVLCTTAGGSLVQGGVQDVVAVGSGADHGRQ